MSKRASIEMKKCIKIEACARGIACVREHRVGFNAAFDHWLLETMQGSRDG